MNQFSVFLVIIAHLLFTERGGSIKCVLQVFGSLLILTRFPVWQWASFLWGCFCGQYIVVRGESGHRELPHCYPNSGSKATLVELVLTEQPSGPEFTPSTVPGPSGVPGEVASRCTCFEVPSDSASASAL